MKAREDHRTALAVVSILTAQVGYVLLAYWARGQTFIAQPGRFRAFETLLSSDFFVFVAPFGLALLLVGLVLSRRSGLGHLSAFVIAAVVALLGEATALFVALNTWGS